MKKQLRTLSLTLLSAAVCSAVLPAGMPLYVYAEESASSAGAEKAAAKQPGSSSSENSGTNVSKESGESSSGTGQNDTVTGDSAVILHTNDVHADIGNYSRLAAYRQELLDEGYDVVTVDAGDAIQGQAIGVLTEGAAIADLMNSVPYDLAVPGNHEFDYGMDAFLDLAEDKEKYPAYQYICCNFKDLDTGRTVFDPYAVKELKGHKVAFVGIDTPESYTKSTPKYFQDENGKQIYGFDEDHLYETVQDAVDDAKADGAECVIAVGHLGEEGVTDAWTSESVIANTTGIDALIDGHDHMAYENTLSNKDGESVVHAETGYSFQNIGRLTLTFSEDGVSIDPELVKASSVAVDENSPENVRSIYGAVQKKIDDYSQQMAYLQEKIGTSETAMATEDADHEWLARYEETPLGDYVADAYRTVLGADIGFVNGGGIRGTGIESGSVTRKDMLDVNPWGNEMGVIEATGQQILDFLELTSRSDWNEEEGRLESNGFFIQTSGLTYEINPAAGPTPVVLDQQGIFQSFDGTKTRRVQNVKVGGEAIDPEKTYTIAGSLYLLQNSAEGNAFFAGDKLVKKSDLTDGDILVAYLTDDLKDQKITAAQYGKAQGRITVLGMKAESAGENPAASATEKPDDKTENPAQDVDNKSEEPVQDVEDKSEERVQDAAAEKPDQSDLTPIAILVIRGNYGVGFERIRLLTEAGYDAAAVQKKVNEVMRSF